MLLVLHEKQQWLLGAWLKVKMNHLVARCCQVSAWNQSQQQAVTIMLCCLKTLVLRALLVFSSGQPLQTGLAGTLIMPGLYSATSSTWLDGWEPPPPGNGKRVLIFPEPPSTHTNYFKYLYNAIFNYMTCRTLMIRNQCRVLFFFSFQKVNFTSVTNSGIRHGVAGKHHVMYSMSKPWFSNRRGIEVTGQRWGRQWYRPSETIPAEEHKWGHQKSLTESVMHI